MKSKILNLISKIKIQCTSVTPFSKLFALCLFISLPFIGGYVGYNYAPAKIVEFERVIVLHNEEVEKVELSEQKNDEDYFLSVVTKEVFLKDDYKIERYTCEAVRYRENGDDCYRLLKKEYSGEYGVLIENITTRYQELFDTKRFLTEQYFPTNSDKIYFNSFLPESSGCCLVTSLQLDTNELTELRVYTSIEGESASPAGRYVALDNGGELLIYDVTSDSDVKNVKISSDETLLQSYCGYSGGFVNFEWIDDNTLKFGVYKKRTSENDTCDTEFIRWEEVNV